MGGSSAGGNGGGSPNQMAKDKAKRDAKKTASVEMGLGKDRMSNYSVAQGGTRETGGNGGNQVVQSSTPKVLTVPEPVTPTTAEVSQSTATDTDADEYDLRKTKKKGRSMTILTSSRGVKPIDDKLTLGKPSLLGS